MTKLKSAIKTEHHVLKAGEKERDEKFKEIAQSINSAELMKLLHCDVRFRNH